MTKALLIFLGAGLGGVLRYAIGGWVQALTGASFPNGTLVVNVIGCLAVGFLGAAFAGPVLIREEYRIAVLVGLLGGFTTFSSFGRETFALAADREMLLAGLNLLLTNGLGLIAVWLGTRLAERIYGV
jgi:CrcB protein